MPALEFDSKAGELSRKIKASGGKIGWIHSLSETPAKFDLTIKDGLGRVKFHKKDFGGSPKAGQLINLPTMVGEDLEVVLENVREAEKVKLFIN